MVQFTATIHKFEKQGEKSGWTYIEIPADIAQQLKPGNKKSFRVKGKLDQFKIAGVSLLPMGGGSFIMAINATMRSMGLFGAVKYGMEQQSKSETDSR